MGRGGLFTVKQAQPVILNIVKNLVLLLIDPSLHSGRQRYVQNKKHTSVTTYKLINGGVLSSFKINKIEE